MSKVRYNGVADALQGRMGVVVFRRMLGKLYASNRPNESTKPASEAQRNHRARFGQTSSKARQAMADPAARPVYERLAAARQTTVFGIAASDVYNPPEVVEIDCAGLTRQIGGQVKILATDDAEVKSVHVTLRDANGSVLEQGAAVLENTHWYYTSTTVLAPEPAVLVSLQDAAGAALDELVAVRVGDTWRAIATVAVPLGSTIVVVATATDAAGNQTEKELGLVVA